MRKKLLKVLLVLLVLVLIAALAAGIFFWRWRHNMGQMTLEQRLEHTLDKIAGDESCGVVFYIYRAADGFAWQGGRNGMTADTPYALASITKMYTAAVVLHLAETGALKLSDPWALYLEPELLAGLHVFEGHDYSAEITVRQLLEHASGLPDYFTESGPGGEAVEEVRKKTDMTYDLAEVVRRAKALTPHFAPDAPGRAWYSDTNYQLLSAVIERASGLTLADAYKHYIFAPLDLQNSRLQTSATVWDAVPICHENDSIQTPGILSSERGAGGIVSTADDNMVFLRAFFAGELFPREYLATMQNWRATQVFPLQYGTGLMRVLPPKPFDKPRYEIIGHAGSLGSVSYYCPARALYIVGTISSLDTPRALMALYRLLICFDFP